MKIPARLPARLAPLFVVLPALLLAAGCGGGGTTTPPDASVVDDLALPVDASVQPDLVLLPGAPITVNVSSVFPAGTALVDRYGGAQVPVAADGTVTVTPHAEGVVLLEKSGAPDAPFSWQNVTVYYAMTDRFNNGDLTNDGSYGRKKDGMTEAGTWHGGDWKGMTAKLDYLAGLGVTAVWISPIVENVHGWVSGGNGDFRHYGYAGYWALDFTRLDANWGSLLDLQTLIDEAHKRKIRVLVDVVINHPGYATGADLLSYVPEVWNDKKGDAFKAFDATMNANLGKWNDLVNYNSDSWVKWWSPKWIRAGFPFFDPAGNDDLTKQLAFLPDFKTEAVAVADVPFFFTRKNDTGFTDQGLTVRQYLVKWHAEWVRQLGIDGFRCDTAKNVEIDSWAELKIAAVAALAEWKQANPGKKVDDAPFWMTGEVFGHGVAKDDYYTRGGFDSLINFAFQSDWNPLVAPGPGWQLSSHADELEAIYARQGAVAGDPTFGILSYASSHDTQLTFDRVGYETRRQQATGTALLLGPGGAQIFYGDESGRKGGVAVSDQLQSTRSDMNWGSMDPLISAHWTKVSAFRKRHNAVGAGAHQRLSSPAGSYAFSRKLDSDAVVVILAPAQ